MVLIIKAMESMWREIEDQELIHVWYHPGTSGFRALQRRPLPSIDLLPYTFYQNQ
jgi:hypothetical protein